jgi:folate-binding protein YgfZ
MASPFAAHILPARAVIRMTGEAPLAFLHNLLTCDLAHLPERTWAYGALLSPQGKIQHDVFVLHEAGTVFVDCAAPQRDSLLKKLALYRLRAKIAIEADDTLAIAAATESGLSPADPRLPSMGSRALVPAGSLTVGSGYETARIVAGLADSTADIGENVMFPHEANLDLLHGVSFTKGCYVGQEVVSRMQHRGTARSRILPVTGVGILPAKGTAIRSGESNVGEMLSSSGSQGLALFRLDRLAETTAPLLAQSVQLRVYKPDWLTVPLELPDCAS